MCGNLEIMSTIRVEMGSEEDGRGVEEPALALEGWGMWRGYLGEWPSVEEVVFAGLSKLAMDG